MSCWSAIQPMVAMASIAGKVVATALWFSITSGIAIPIRPISFDSHRQEGRGGGGGGD